MTYCMPLCLKKAYDSLCGARLSLKIRSTVNCSLNTQLDFKQPSANILPYLISQCLNVPNREKGIEMLTRPRCFGEFMYARFVHLKSL